MIGLSLSFCIKDVLTGKMPVEAIDKIIAGTKYEDDAAFDGVLDAYAEVYWTRDPERGKRIARNLHALGLIEQPRLTGDDPPSIADGHWIPGPTEEGKRPTL